MTKLTSIPLWQDLPFETTVPADRLPSRRPRDDEGTDWESSRPLVRAEPVTIDWSVVVMPAL